MRLSLSTIGILLIHGSLLAATIHVPADQPSIQAGIDAAAAGDTVLLAAQTYSGAGNTDLLIDQVNLVLLGAGGAENTIIDGELSNGGLTLFGAQLTNATVIQGLSIVRVYGGGNGGGLRIDEASPVVKDCIFRDNEANYNGGGIWCGYGPGVTQVSGCWFSGNEARFRAGGMMVDHSEALISGCVFYGNTSNDIGGGAIQGNIATVAVEYCTVVDNTALVGGGGIHMSSSACTVSNTLLAQNRHGGAVWGVGTVTHSLSFGNEGGNELGNGDQNIYLDPLFCDWSVQNYHLHLNSPCLAASPDNPWGEDIGALGSACDVSAASRQSWGDIKVLYR